MFQAPLGLALAASLAPGLPDVDALLAEGHPARAVAVLEAHLIDHPEDAERRLGLGVAGLALAVERLGRGLHRHGFDPVGQDLLGWILPAWPDLPVPENPRPEPIDHAALTGLLQDWLDDLARVEQALAPLGDAPVGLLLHPTRVRLDLDGDGEPELPLLTPAADGTSPGSAPELAIRFDSADVAWLRGYVALLSATTQMVLAHDTQALFDRTAQLAFPQVVSPYPFLSDWRRLDETGWEWIQDAIALLFGEELAVAEPERMGHALQRLRDSVAHGQELWTRVMEETDDDREWIPSPRQAGALGMDLSRDQIDAWRGMLDEARAILAGEKLVPFWRGDGDLGLDVSRIFTEPRGVHLVSWIQGPAAVPYLEQGELTDLDTWRAVREAFGPGLLVSAVWLN